MIFALLNSGERGREGKVVELSQINGQNGNNKYPSAYSGKRQSWIILTQGASHGIDRNRRLRSRSEAI